MTQTGDDHLWPVLGTTAAGQQMGTQQQVGASHVLNTWPEDESNEHFDQTLLQMLLA
jgi:hypothetical protein